jgi:acyl-CoA thioester hydrolase
VHVADDGWFRWQVPVRFRDLDPMGHAHHTLPLIYLEEARAAFWRELRSDDSLEAIDYVMAEVTLRFHARTRYPGTAHVLLGIGDVGNSSFRMLFEIRATDGTLLSSGTTVQVYFDYAAGTSKPVPESDRAALQLWREVKAGASEEQRDTR